MKVLIFKEDTTSFEYFNATAEKYFLENLPKQYKVSYLVGNSDIFRNAICKFNYIILLTTSQFIQDNLDIIWENKNKLFISPTSTVETLRGKSDNLLFNATTNPQLLTIPLFLEDVFILYDGNVNDLYVSDLV